MPKIPTYSAGNLASEHVGVPQEDKSGQIIAKAFTDLASTTFDIAEKQNKLLKQAELTKLVSQYDSELALKAADIRRNNVSSPDEANRQLEEAQAEMLSRYKETIKDPEVKTRFDAAGTQSNYQERTRTGLWAFGENNKIIQKNHSERIDADISRAAMTDDFNDVINMAWKLDADRETIYQAWGGVSEGSRVIDMSQAALVKSYFYNQLSKGNAFKVLKELDDGRLNPTEYTWKGGEKQQSNGFLPPDQLKTMRDAAVALVRKGKDDSANLTLMGMVSENFNIDEDIRQPIATTEEKINALSFEIDQQRELVANGQVAPEQVASLEKQQKYYETVRAQQLNIVEAQIVPNEEVEADMAGRFATMFKKKEGKPLSFKSTLEEVYQFQKDLLENRDQIDPKNFSKWSALTKAVFQSEIDGRVKGSKFQTKKGFFGFGDMEAAKPEALSASKKLQGVLSEVIKKQGPKATNADTFETMMFFIDELDERNALKDPSVLSLMSQAELDKIGTAASQKAALKKAGLPIYLGVEDTVEKQGRRWRITGFKDGRVWVDPEK